MCGISGILGPNAENSENQKFVSIMNQTLRHRGPDSQGTHHAKGYALGHCRLAIIDLEHGNQPMVSPCGRYVLVFNGEIYNYLELREELKKTGVEFRTSSDTEVLLHMLIHHGTKTFSQINGMFAFAFVDQKKGEWILSVDPFGIKPLYYSSVKNQLIFASEIKALLKHPALLPQCDWNSLQEYLTLQFCLKEKTLFKNIYKVKPGCYLKGTFQNNRFQENQYWDSNFSLREDFTKEYVTEELLKLLKDSIRLQIRSDVPLGTYLSGGLDSSVITRLVKDHLSPKAFHGRFNEGPAYDESKYAKIFAQKEEIELLEIIPTEEDFVDKMASLIYAMDEPAAGPGLFPQHMVCKLAAQHVKVVLGGQGGDELFGGYARFLIGYFEQALKGAIFGTHEEGKYVVHFSSILPHLEILKPYVPLMKHFWKEGLFDAMDARYFRLIDRSPAIQSLLTASALKKYNKAEVFCAFQEIFNRPETSSYINKMTNFDMKALLPALLQIEDRMSMAVSLESRVPFLDTRIVDLITQTPPVLKFWQGETKFLLKSAVKDITPGEILNRKDKMGFPVPLKEWMTKGKVRNFLKDILLSPSAKNRGLFRTETLEDLLQNEATFGRQIWGALCLELWFREFRVQI